MKSQIVEFRSCLDISIGRPVSRDGDVPLHSSGSVCVALDDVDHQRKRTDVMKLQIKIPNTHLVRPRNRVSDSLNDLQVNLNGMDKGFEARIIMNERQMDDSVCLFSSRDEG